MAGKILASPAVSLIVEIASCLFSTSWFVTGNMAGSATVSLIVEPASGMFSTSPGAAFPLFIELPALGGKSEISEVWDLA